MTIDDWNEDISKELAEMMEQGISSFKMYMTYPAMMIPEGDLYRALLRLKALNGVAGVHCENDGVIRVLTAEAKAAGRLAPWSHPRTRPAPLEAEAVGHLLRLAQLADVPVIIVHLSSRESLEEVRAARRRGQTVYVETCPHYLLLEDGVYDNPDFMEAAKFVCAPPLRKREDREALWEALRGGEIDTVATDHCSFTAAQKRAGRYDFTRIPGGLPGVEHRGVLLYTYGVAAAMVNFEREGYFAVATQVGSAVTRDALAAIDEQIARLACEPMPEEELALVKNIMAGEMMRILDGPFGIADVTIENLLCGTGNEAVDENLRRIRAVTPDEVRRLAARYLGRGELVTVVAGAESPW